MKENIIELNGYYVDLSTGAQGRPTDEFVKHSIDDLKQHYSEVKQVATEAGIDFKGRFTTSDYKSKLVAVKRNRSYHFVKVFDEMQELLTNSALDVYSLAFMARFTPYVSHPENSLQVNGSYPTTTELAYLLGIKKNKLLEILKALRFYDVIRTEKNGRGIIIYFNPYLLDFRVR